MVKYTMNDYINDISKKAKKHEINTIKTLENKFESDLFVVDNYGEMYEIGLEYENKINKKERGKYYTPKDVATIMCKWLIPLDGENICDVGCGTGNLILNYLDLIGKDNAYELLKRGKVYLYDIDDIALEICKYTIAIKYGKEIKK